MAKQISEVPQGTNESCIVSRYIDNPLLVFGHKFDLRLYVVVTCFDPLRVYIFREGLVRFASEKYNTADLGSEEAKFSHLTNYSINKKNQKFQSAKAQEDDDSGFKWSLGAF